MWLLNTTTLKLEECIGSAIPQYAILSHTWGPDSEEVSFKDIRKDFEGSKKKKGFRKIEKCCEKAKSDKYNWAWIDTCCIDRRSSAQLTEAMNSMFAWYKRAGICYAYLEDFPAGSCGADGSGEIFDTLSKCRWFTRGWTLQELIAPSKVQFFAEDWSYIGSKNGSHHEIKLMAALEKITGVRLKFLQHSSRALGCSVAERMSWASSRKTTREEDWAYSLMGLFDVNMPIIYGEGLEKAFKRLQLEIIQKSPDQSIFAWKAQSEGEGGLLASSPRDFENCTFVVGSSFISASSGFHPFSMTNIGLHIRFHLTEEMDVDYGTVCVASLTCWTPKKPDEPRQRVQLYLKRLEKTKVGSKSNLFQRVHCHNLKFARMDKYVGEPEDIYVLDNVQAYLLEDTGAFVPFRGRRLSSPGR